jgi:hypothetical protein
VRPLGRKHWGRKQSERYLHSSQSNLSSQPSSLVQRQLKTWNCRRRVSRKVPKGTPHSQREQRESSFFFSVCCFSLLSETLTEHRAIYKERIGSSGFWSLESPCQGAAVSLVSGKSLLAVSYLMWCRASVRQNKLLAGVSFPLFIKLLIKSQGPHLHDLTNPNYLPKTLPPNITDM